MAQNQGVCLEMQLRQAEKEHTVFYVPDICTDYHISYLTNLNVKLDFTIEGIVLVWASNLPRAQRAKKWQHPCR